MPLPTLWFPSNRQGTAIIVPNSLFITNDGKYIVDNTASHNNLATTTIQLVPQPPTEWTVV